MAIKLLAADLPDQRAGYHRELGVLRRLSGHGAPRLFDVGRDGGWFYITMDLVSGTPFPGEAATRDPTRLQRLVASLLWNLGRVHQRGVIHGDIKPKNVLVDADGNAALIDFGVAEVITAGTRRLRRDGEFIGTRRYAAPEQHRGGVLTERVANQLV